MDVEKAGAKSEASSARGSAQFLAEVESRRSIKVSPHSNDCPSSRLHDLF